MVATPSTKTITLILKMVRLLLVLALPMMAILFLRNRNAQSVFTPPSMPSAPLGQATETPRELAWYAPLWERDLRQPPFPPAPPPEPVQPTVSTEAPRLVATFVDENSRFAHLMDRDGKLLFKEINDEVGSYRVAAIEPGRVELATGSRTLWIEVPKRKD